MDDIRAACLAIADYLSRTDAAEDIIFDAIRMRLIEIGEATKDLTPRPESSNPASRGAISPGYVITWPTATSTRRTQS